LGLTSESIYRIAALATYAIDDGCNGNGHTFLSHDDIKEKIHNFDWTVQVDDAIAAAIKMGEPIINDSGMYYSRSLYLAEKFLSTDLGLRLRSKARKLSTRDPEQIEEAIKLTCAKIGVKLDASQHAAVKGILTSASSIHSITSGPGCGKTFVVEVILSILKDYKNIGFAAPTGKAARVLQARVSKYGSKATTIHSMLGVGGNGKFMYHQGNKLPYDLLVCDETSMVSLSLMNAVFSALREDAHIIFLGDANQLPSVDPGDILRNLMSLDYDHHRLTKTHRNDGGILEVVNLAGQGLSDFSKLRHDVEFHDGLPEPTLETVQNVIDKFDSELEAMGGDFTAVGLLIARRKGDVNVPGWNTTYLNHVMRNRYNADGKHIPGTIYRVGDRIIIRKNLALKQAENVPADTPPELVVNGDVGFIRGFTKKTSGKKGDDGASNGTLESLILELDDGRELLYGAENVSSLTLGYALTVHASQGSEYARVVSIAVSGHANVIHRGIIFTAWSRAQKKLTIIGDSDAIKKMLFRLPPSRNTFLVQRTLLAMPANHLLMAA
jgi:exodeoxyribonuclease V alpha subunit